MESSKFFSALERRYPAETSARISAALYQDENVWHALDDPDYCQRVLDADRNSLLFWCPANLALIALGGDGNSDYLSVQPMAAIDVNLRQQAVRMYEEVTRRAAKPVNLREAGLLALALRERRRMTGNWNGFANEILYSWSDAKTGSGLVWRTALTCLYGMIPDPNEMVAALLKAKEIKLAADWVAHILLCLPMDELDRSIRLVQLLSDLPAPRQIEVLKVMQFRAGEALTRRTAGALLSRHPLFAGFRMKVDLDQISPELLAARILTLQHLATFNQLAGSPAQAAACLKLARQAADYWLGGLDLQTMSNAADEGLDCFVDGLTDNLLNLVPQSRRMSSELSTLFVRNPDNHCAVERLEAIMDEPMAQMGKALVAFGEGESSLASSLGKRAAAGFIVALSVDGHPFIGDFVSSWEPIRFINGLSRMGLIHEAAECAGASLKIRPSDPVLLGEYTRLQLKEHNCAEARMTARIAAAIVPGDLSIRRQLSEADECTGDWTAAYQHRKDCLAFRAGNQVEDQLSFSRAAIMAGKAEEAEELCREILKTHPDLPGANGWLGMASARLGDRDQAAYHLNRATQLAPEEVEWWLMLAEMYQQVGENQQAYETLRAAVMAVPESGRVYVALSSFLLAEGLSSEALPYLKHGFDLLPDDEQIGLQLSKVLHQLGHLEDARLILQKLRHKWAGLPELAYQYARIVEDQGDIEEAIPALELAVRSEQVKPEWMMAYAAILIDENGTQAHEPVLDQIRSEKAAHILNKALELVPENLQVHLLMADVLRRKGNYQEALELYQGLAEEPGGVQDDLVWRIQRGLGLTALALNMVELGLAAIKDASLRQPKRADIQRELSNAYYMAHLVQDADLAAQAALSLAPHDQRNLEWYAGIMANLGDLPRAEEALLRAVDLAPENGNLQIRLAQLQFQNGKQEEAHNTLTRVAQDVKTGSEALRKTAQVWVQMTNLPAALDCLERAASRSDAPSSELMYDLAQLYDQLGQPLEAVEALQKAAGPGCKDAKVHLSLAKLLTRQNRIQAAQPVFEKALRVAEIEPAARRLPLEAAIYHEMAISQIKSGSLSGALHLAEKALERDPKDGAIRAQAASLALGLTQFEHAKQLAGTPAEGDRTVAALVRAEACFEMGDFAEAAQAWEMASESKQDGLWLTSIEARLEHKSGDWTVAARLAGDALAKISAEASPRREWVWVAKGIVEAGLWKQGVQLLEEVLQAYPGDPAGSYELGKVFVLAAEYEQDCEAVSCLEHRPDLGISMMAAYARFKQLFEYLSKTTPSGDVHRWHLRGEMAFALSAQTMKDFATVAVTAEDTSALVRALRLAGNWPGAALAAQTHPKDGGVLFQLCVGYLEEDPETGCAITADLTVQTPHQPLVQALRSMLAEKAERLSDALTAISEAAALWPTEYAWQAKAGDLAMQLDDAGKAVASWKAAVALRPGKGAYHHSLGRSYLLAENYHAAVGSLGYAATLIPQNVDCWLELAYAHKVNGDLARAMEAAQHANEADLVGVKGVLLCSDVAREMGEGDMAGEYARLAIRKEPQNPYAVLALSKALTQQGLHKESLDEIEEHLAELPSSLPLLFERARLVYHLNGAAAASSLLIKLAASFPEEPEVLALLANAQAEAEDLKGAERSALRSLRLNPNQPDLGLMLGKIQRKSGQLDQAVHWLVETIRTRPDLIDTYLELGDVYQDRREHAKALEVYRRVIQAFPKDPRGYFQSALIFKDSKDYLSAETMLQQAAKLSPDDVQTRRQLIAVMALNLLHKSQEANTPV